MCFNTFDNYGLWNRQLARIGNWQRHKNVKRWEKTLLELSNLTWFQPFINSTGSSAVSRAVNQIVVFHYKRIILFVGCTCVLIMFNKLVLGMLICAYGCRDEAALKGKVMMTVRIALPVGPLWQSKSGGVTRMSKDNSSLGQSLEWKQMTSWNCIFNSDK